MITLTIFSIIAFAAGLFDAWTTNKCIEVGLVEDGILTKYIIGTKPSTLKVYLFNWATWTILFLVSLYVFGLAGLVALVPQIAQIAGHTWAGYHNMGQYDSWTKK